MAAPRSGYRGSDLVRGSQARIPPTSRGWSKCPCTRTEPLQRHER